MNHLTKGDFFYELPEHLIAQQPIPGRSGSRMMLIDRCSGEYRHKMFGDITEILRPGDCIVINDTKVIPARLLGERESGAKIEILLHQRLEDSGEGLARFEALVKPGRKCQAGDRIVIGGGAIIAEVDALREEGLRALTMRCRGDFDELLEQYGQVPLPHYIKREGVGEDTGVEGESGSDKERYQTVYAEHEGSVAAPTAGLHFTPEILQRLQARGIEIARITLHVGLGTFRPVKADKITDHNMHSEYYRVLPAEAAKINAAKENGGRIIAIGTTSCRTLESCADQPGTVVPGTGWTDIYIYPGFEFRVIDGLLTNFHLPESTLIMLVSAFCDRDKILAAYGAAIEEEYRFFSFGDCMLLI